jgi:hypothetical protein
MEEFEIFFINSRGAGTSNWPRFSSPIRRRLLRFLYRGYTLVPAPSFAAKNEARGFNHVELMFAPLHFPFIVKRPSEKLDDVKQADLHYAGAAENRRTPPHYVDGWFQSRGKRSFSSMIFSPRGRRQKPVVISCAMAQPMARSELKFL